MIYPARDRSRSASILLLLAAGAIACGCNSKGQGADALAKIGADEEPPQNVPVPSATGPQLYLLKDAQIFDRPSSAGRVLGSARAGATLPRSTEPYSRKGCDEGWYVVRPRGFVCAHDVVTPTRTDAFLAYGPDVSRALPYRYGRARTEGVPLYAHAPSPAEQLALEPDLPKHLRKAQSDDQEVLGAAANDVPLDARGVATGPAVIQPGADGVDPSSKRLAGLFYANPAPAPFPALLSTGAPEAKAPLLRKGSGVAIAGTFAGNSGSSPRSFGLTASGRLVPIDRLRPSLGPTWHGIDLEKAGLPVGFVHKRGVHTWHVSHGKATKNDDELDRRTGIALTGKFRTVDGIRYDETRDGNWLRAQDFLPVVKRSKFPDFVRPGQKWLDVSLANQTITAYDGTKPIYATLVSTGRDTLGDPATAAATPRGTFRVKTKHITRALDPKEVQNGFDVADAPWVLELDQGTSLAAAYWSDVAGEASTQHDVLMSPIDARRLWSWADPQLPDGWASVSDAGGDTTIVNVRP